MIKVILTDIEGTTSSISFVKDVLFPYAYERMETFLTEKRSDTVVQNILIDVAKEAKLLNPTLSELSEHLRQWITADLKITPLKMLQGLIWENGYKQGDYKAHIYPDAFNKLHQWNGQNLPLFVYSSGSVYAQKLFFGYSEYGDLTPLFSGYFDTTIGGKKEKQSYLKIAKEMAVQPEHILFLSDINEELDAASDAGLQTILLNRTDAFSESTHKTVQSFNDIHTN